MALEESSDEDYIDKEINRKIALKRTESVKSVVKECINENDDILFRIKRRSKKEQEAFNQQQLQCSKENYFNVTTSKSVVNTCKESVIISDSNANSICDNTCPTSGKSATPEALLQNTPSQNRQQDLRMSTTDTEANAAVIIQSVFKGYKTRKELGEVSAFYCNTTSEEQLEVDDFEPIHRKNPQASESPNEFVSQPKKKWRQDSYLQAVSSPTEEVYPDVEEILDNEHNEPSNSLTRPWKKRQDSYLAAITGTLQSIPGGEEADTNASVVDQTVKWKNRQDSYLIAINATFSSQSRTGGPAHVNNNSSESKSRNVRSNGRQGSYEQAIVSALPVDTGKEIKNSLNESDCVTIPSAVIATSQQYKQSHHSRRQDSYQQAIMTSSATEKNFTGSEEYNNQKNLAANDDSKKQENQQQIGDKLNQWAGKKQSRSPRRRPEAYQRPCSSSSEEDKNINTSHLKRGHRQKVNKKSSEKSSESQDLSNTRSISKFSEAADVVRAAKRIQSAYRSYKAREEIRLHHDEEIKRRRRKKTSEKVGKVSSGINPSKKKHYHSHRAAWADVVNAVITIQKAYRKYRKEKILRGLGVTEDLEQAEKAIIKIQSHVKGFQTRRAITKNSNTQIEKHIATYSEKPKLIRPVKVSKPVKKPFTKIKIESTQKSKAKIVSKDNKQTIPVTGDSLSQSPVQQQYKKRPLRTETYVVEESSLSKAQAAKLTSSTLVIQRWFRGYKVRKELKIKKSSTLQHPSIVTNDDLPDLKAADVAAAAIKIQAAYKGFKTRKAILHREDLPDLNSEEVQNAATKIQSAYKGFKTRKELKNSSPDLPDLTARDVVAAAVKIQSAYKGFRTRQKTNQIKNTNSGNDATVEAATIKIQSAYRGFKTRQELKNNDQDLPDLKAADVAAATIKIQAAFKGFKTRKIIKEKKNLTLKSDQDLCHMQPKDKHIDFEGKIKITENENELPDLKAADVVASTIKIQAAYKGFQTRKKIKQQRDNFDIKNKNIEGTTQEIPSKKLQPTNDEQSLPDLNSEDVAAATVKIQAAFKGFQTRQMLKEKKETTLNGDSLPNLLVSPSLSDGHESEANLKCDELQDAVVKIQSAYRGFKTRKELQQAGEELPNLNAADVAAATIKIQAAYKGYKTRLKMRESTNNFNKESRSAASIDQPLLCGKKKEELSVSEEDLPDLGDADVAAATVKIQAAFKGFRTRKHMTENRDSVSKFSCAQSQDATSQLQANHHGHQTKKDTLNRSLDLPDLNAADVMAAAVRIQSAYKGFRTRQCYKNHNKNGNSEKLSPVRSLMISENQEQDMMPDLKAADVAAATIKIQAAYKGFRTRKFIKQREALPDLKCSKVQDATVKIQSAYKGYRTRKELKIKDEQDLPDLKAADVAAAAVKIQAAFKGFKTRQALTHIKSDLPDLGNAKVQAASVKIQSAYRGFKTRKELQKTGQDLPDLKAADVVAAAVKIQAVYKGFKTRQMTNKQLPNLVAKNKEVLEEIEKLPDLTAADVAAATIKIQSAYKGFRTRQAIRNQKETLSVSGSEKMHNNPHDNQSNCEIKMPNSNYAVSNLDTEQPLPDLLSADVNAATLKIQAAYRGYQTRQLMHCNKDILPNLNCTKVQDATVKIQSAYRGFKTRKELKAAGNDLPDLSAKDVAAAAIKIQAVYKGFKARQAVKHSKVHSIKSTEVPKDRKNISSVRKEVVTKAGLAESEQIHHDLAAADIAAAALKIQAYYRGFKVRNAYRKQVSKQQESAANIAAAALLCQLGMCRAIPHINI